MVCLYFDRTCGFFLTDDDFGKGLSWRRLLGRGSGSFVLVYVYVYFEGGGEVFVYLGGWEWRWDGVGWMDGGDGVDGFEVDG